MPDDRNTGGWDRHGRMRSPCNCTARLRFAWQKFRSHPSSTDRKQWPLPVWLNLNWRTWFDQLSKVDQGFWGQRQIECKQKWEEVQWKGRSPVSQLVITGWHAFLVSFYFLDNRKRRSIVVNRQLVDWWWHCVINSWKTRSRTTTKKSKKVDNRVYLILKL